MTVEDPIQPLLDWLLPGEHQYGAILVFLAGSFLFWLGFFFLGYLFAAAAQGPWRAFGAIQHTFVGALDDLLQFSFKRTWSLTWLACREAIRAKALVVFAVFIVIVLFAGWFLDVDTDDPAKLYTAFVLQSSRYLVLLLAVVMSVFSIPKEISNRTIYTVVTKPVRVVELVLGKMLGFTLTGTFVLLVLGVVSYLFVWRGLAHTHQVELDSLVTSSEVFDENGNLGMKGQTTRDQHHRHEVTITPDGGGYTDINKGHRHRVTKLEERPISLSVDADGRQRTITIPAQGLANAGIVEDADGMEVRSLGITVIESDGGQVEISDVRTGSRAYEQGVRPGMLIATVNSQSFDDLSELGDLLDKALEDDYVVGPPVGHMEAKVVEYGKLSFLDKNGLPAEKGVNVGNEWTYRSFIQGDSLAAATWEFDGITRRQFAESEFPDGIPVEMTLRVFRTHKGDIEQGVHGTIEVVEYVPPDETRRPLTVLVASFQAKEFSPDRFNIPRKLKKVMPNGTTQNIDLFDDLAHDGKLLIRVQCLDRGQYFGAAMPDMYLLTGNNWFVTNFAKCYLGIWLQMVIVIAFSVMFSTFLRGEIAGLSTASAMLIATFLFKLIHQLYKGVVLPRELADSEAWADTTAQEGGGPIEALIRIVEQSNMVTPLEDGGATTVVKALDGIAVSMMQGFSFLLPKLWTFDTSAFVASGYDIPSSLLAQGLITTIAYFLSTAAVGYFIFKSREVGLPS